MVFINQLPQESRTLTEIRDALTPARKAQLLAETTDQGYGRWSRTDMLLAAQVDEIRHQTWILAEWERGKRPPAPEPLRRPGVEEKQARPKTVEELRERVSEKAWARAEALRQGKPLPD